MICDVFGVFVEESEESLVGIKCATTLKACYTVKHHFDTSLTLHDTIVVGNTLEHDIDIFDTFLEGISLSDRIGCSGYNCLIFTCEDEEVVGRLIDNIDIFLVVFCRFDIFFVVGISRTDVFEDVGLFGVDFISLYKGSVMLFLFANIEKHFGIGCVVVA